MSLFDDYVKSPIEYGINNPLTGLKLPKQFSRLHKYTGNIEKGQIITVGGKPTSGKTSFMDFVYVVNILVEWSEMNKVDRPKLKIFYFNLRRSPKLKLQKWLCLWLKLKYDIVIDPSTLNNGLGKIYDLDEDKLEKINEGIEFFKEVEDDALVFISGKNSPSSIFNRLVNYMQTTGAYDASTRSYTPNSDYMNTYNIVCVDNIDCVEGEYDGGSMLSGDYLKRKLFEYMQDLKEIFNMTVVLCVPTKPQNYLRVKDGEPSYRELGQARDISDLGIILYNPYNENNFKYANYSTESFVIRAKNRLRTATLVVNLNGLENVGIGLLFLGECGYFNEAPLAEDEEKITQVLAVLRKIP